MAERGLTSLVDTVSRRSRVKMKFHPEIPPWPVLILTVLLDSVEFAKGLPKGFPSRVQLHRLAEKGMHLPEQLFEALAAIVVMLPIRIGSCLRG